MGGWYELAIRLLVRRPREVAADRGQSQVIGAILIFGFLIAGLGLYQATIVPQQTSEVELQHSETVKDDFAGVHSAIAEAGSANDLRTASVKLGTRYPPRALTLNPSPVYGRVSISDIGGSIGFSNAGFTPAAACGSSATQPKTLTYKADYNRFNNAGSHGYETSVTYHSVDGKITDSSQVLVQGTTIRLLPLVDGSLSTSGITSKTLEFEGGKTGGNPDTAPITSTTATPLSLTLPTELDKPQWKSILSDADKVQKITEPTSGRIKITFKPGQYTIRCTPIGEGKAPSNSPVLTPGGGGGGSSGPSPGFGINPNEEGEVFLKNTAPVKNKQKTTKATFQYEPKPSGPSSTSIVSARVNFVSPDAPGFSGSGSDTVRICDATDTTGATSEDFEVAGDTKSFDVPIPVSNSGKDIKFTFNPGSTNGKMTSKSFYVVTFKLSNGEVGTYFLSHPDGTGSTSVTACPAPTP